MSSSRAHLRPSDTAAPSGSDADWTRVRALFEELVDLEAGERERRLAELEGPLRAQLERLLAADATPEAVLTPPPTPGLGGLGAMLLLPPGQHVGSYRLVRPIGSGGMGVVFEAEQERPRRRVALKTLRAETSGEAARRRFRTEVEILGRLQHPGIAQIYDAGTFETAQGEHPYYAMELVPDARTIVDWAQHAGLDLDARLALFAQVCTAVDHGHRRGIVHRDLKPGNVLVGSDGQPKVIDFGLARPEDPGSIRVTLAETGARGVYGTLPYMSPEQIEGDASRVDARSDVYSLGCVLCELVTGRPPHDLRRLSLTEALQHLTEREPEVPGDMPRELSWITRRAIHRWPSRRYPTALELAADVERFRRRDAVLASPPSRRYRLVVAARRHRAFLVGVAAVIAALATGLWRARAEATQRRFHAEIGLGVSDFLADLFVTVNAYQDGPDAKIRDVLAEAGETVDDVEDPRVRGILRALVGQGYLNLQDFDEAERFLAAAVEEVRASLPLDSKHRLHAEAVWADLLEWIGRYEESRALTRQLLARAEDLLGPEHDDTEYLRTNLAVCESRLGNPAEAERLYREALALAEARFGADSPPAVNLHHRVGQAVMQQGRLEDADDELAAATERALRTFGEDNLYVATLRMDHASLRHDRGQLADAERLLRLAYRDHRRLEAPATNRLASAMNLAAVLATSGDPDKVAEAAGLLDEAFSLADAYGSGPNGARLVLHNVAATVRREEGDLARAEEEARASLRVAAELFGPANPQRVRATLLLAEILAEAGDVEEARELARGALSELPAGHDGAEALREAIEALPAAAR